MRKIQIILLVIPGFCLFDVSTGVFAAEGANTVWNRHVIDDTSEGADGVRLADVNGDGLLDIATGWEEGGVVKVYLNPGPARVKTPWPNVIVGHVKSPEDAVLTDVNGDGAVDVVSACEGNEQTVYVHWAPKNAADYLDASLWRTEAFPASQNRMKWMFVAPKQTGGG
ncbi:MAG: VCBS repeat-containing protein, partial [Candidatus Hydrogenedentes bacterium]|nr:VCBS repeat-containing protein [Candidatus Hydrogenedentota bacterium]